MKATHTALASLSLLLLTAPSANSDVVSNDRTAGIAFVLGDSASLCEAVATQIGAEIYSSCLA